MLMPSQIWPWFRRGLMQLFTVPSLILIFAFTGYAGLCRDSGFTLAETVFMAGTIWALPANVVLIGAVLSKASILTAALSVGLSSIRLLPMTVAIMPEMRTDKTSKVLLYVISHFVAVTAWIMALERFRTVPKESRAVFFAGLGTGFLVANLSAVALAYELADDLPPLLSAALIFITPLYFLFSLWGSARERESHLAMGLGLALTPVFHALSPKTDILLTGVTGGILAWAAGWLARRRRA